MCKKQCIHSRGTNSNSFFSSELIYKLVECWKKRSLQKEDYVEKLCNCTFSAVVLINYRNWMQINVHPHIWPLGNLYCINVIVLHINPMSLQPFLESGKVVMTPGHNWYQNPCYAQAKHTLAYHSLSWMWELGISRANSVKLISLCKRKSRFSVIYRVLLFVGEGGVLRVFSFISFNYLLINVIVQNVL